MSDINKEIERIKNEGLDLITTRTNLLNLKLPHTLLEVNSYFDYSGFYFNKSGGFTEKITLKLIVLDGIFQGELEVNLIGKTYMNTYRNLKTSELEGEYIEGFRIKDWQIINYNLNVSYGKSF